jgi:hypothetical protein
MLLRKNVNFLISVPFTDAFAKQLVINEKINIDRVDDTILTSKMPIRGIHKLQHWEKDQTKINTFAYCDTEKALKNGTNIFNI